MHSPSGPAYRDSPCSPLQSHTKQQSPARTLGPNHEMNAHAPIINWQFWTLSEEQIYIVLNLWYFRVFFIFVVVCNTSAIVFSFCLWLLFLVPCSYCLYHIIRSIWVNNQTGSFGFRIKVLKQCWISRLNEFKRINLINFLKSFHVKYLG